MLVSGEDFGGAFDAEGGEVQVGDCFVLGAKADGTIQMVVSSTA